MSSMCKIARTSGTRSARARFRLSCRGARYEIQETVLPGVFRVRTCKQSGDALYLEVGAVPAVVAAAAEHGTSQEFPLEDPPPPGLMNAQPLLAELRYRMMSRAPGRENHVVKSDAPPPQ